MHIHGAGMNPNAANLYSTGAAENAAAARRAAETRKKLARNAQEIDSTSTPEQGFLVGQWMDSRHSQVLSEDEYHPSAAGKDPDFG
ncbi:MAG: hypothetical protein WBE76_17010 [Terracidiphilus sp.]